MPRVERVTVLKMVRAATGSLATLTSPLALTHHSSCWRDNPCSCALLVRNETRARVWFVVYYVFVRECETRANAESFDKK